VRVAEVDRDAGGDGEAGVAGHLDALVPGDAAGQPGGQRADGFAYGLLDQVRVTAFGQVQKQQVADGPLDQGADRGAADLADDQVAFPVAGHGPVPGLGGTFADHHHVLDVPGPAVAAAGAAPGPARAQAPGQLPAQLAAALHVQRLVDGLVAHMHHGIARELDPQPTGDLHRRPPFVQPAGDLGRQLRAA
jgi:hypothetical protein